jgi:23S rRNA pseudouridine1911/1915/1917 synthase
MRRLASGYRRHIGLLYRGGIVDVAFKPIPEPRIVFEGGGIIVVAKPAGMHCAPTGSPEGDAAGDPSTLCAWLFGLRPTAAAIRGRGKGEGGLLHRLDAPTSGLVAFASDEDAFAAVIAAAGAGKFVKRYRALGVPVGSGLLGSKPESIAPAGVDASTWSRCLRGSDLRRISDMLSGTAVESRFRPYGPGAARVACSSPDSTPSGGGKAWTRDAYRSDIAEARPYKDGVLAEIELSRGFRHQVRAHMAWLGLPLEGDRTYGDGEPGELRLRAYRLSFPAPRGGGTIVVDLDDNDIGA